MTAGGHTGYWIPSPIGSVLRCDIAGDMGALNFVHFLLVLQCSDHFALVSCLLSLVSCLLSLVSYLLVFWSSGLWSLVSSLWSLVCSVL